jgi:hypothetical protein
MTGTAAEQPWENIQPPPQLMPQASSTEKLSRFNENEQERGNKDGAESHAIFARR